MSLFFEAIFQAVSRLFKLHWGLFFLMIALCTSGLFFIHSATYTSDLEFLHNAANQQITWIGAGLVLFFGLSMISYRTLVDYSLWLFGGSLLLLIATLIFAHSINGSKSWLPLGPIRIQPAEFTKLAYICALAHILLVFHDQIQSLRLLIAVAFMGLVPCALILKQPDLGSALVFGPITFMALYVAGAKKRYLFLPIVAVASIIMISYIYVYKQDRNLPLLKPYQNDRIRMFFDPSRDPRGAGWTITQSLIAIGSGGLKGKGYMKGDQNVYGFVPKNIAHNDFIFSVIGEEFGFIGGGGIIIAEGFLLLCAIQIAMHASEMSGALVATGIVGMLFTHFFINIGMTIKVVPITGIPLPFVSYGGTFMAVCMAAMGILQSIWIERHQRPSL